MANRRSYNNSYYGQRNNFYSYEDNNQWSRFRPNNYQHSEGNQSSNSNSKWYSSPNQYNHGERNNSKFNRNNYKPNDSSYKDRSRPNAKRFDSKHHSKSPFNKMSNAANDKKSIESEPTAVTIESSTENEKERLKKVEEDKIRLEKLFLSSETLPSMDIDNSLNSVSDENKEMLAKRESCLTLPTLELTESDYKEIGAIAGHNLQDEYKECDDVSNKFSETYTDYEDENCEDDPLSCDVVVDDSTAQSVLDVITGSVSKPSTDSVTANLTVDELHDVNELKSQLTDENPEDHTTDVIDVDELHDVTELKKQLTDENSQDHSVNNTECTFSESSLNNQEISETITEPNDHPELITTDNYKENIFLENKENDDANSCESDINNYNIVQNRETIIGFIDRSFEQNKRKELNKRKEVHNITRKSETQCKIFDLYKSFLKYRRYGTSNALKNKMLKFKRDSSTGNPFLNKDNLSIILKQIATETECDSNNKSPEEYTETLSFAEETKTVDTEDLDQTVTTQKSVAVVEAAEKDVDEFMENYGHLLDDSFIIPNEVLQKLGLSDYLEELALNEEPCETMSGGHCDEVNEEPAAECSSINKLSSCNVESVENVFVAPQNVKSLETDNEDFQNVNQATAIHSDHLELASVKDSNNVIENMSVSVEAEKHSQSSDSSQLFVSEVFSNQSGTETEDTDDVNLDTYINMLKYKSHSKLPDNASEKQAIEEKKKEDGCNDDLTSSTFHSNQSTCTLKDGSQTKVMDNNSEKLAAAEDSNNELTESIVPIEVVQHADSSISIQQPISVVPHEQTVPDIPDKTKTIETSDTTLKCKSKSARKTKVVVDNDSEKSAFVEDSINGLTRSSRVPVEAIQNVESSNCIQQAASTVSRSNKNRLGRMKTVETSLVTSLEDYVNMLIKIDEEIAKLNNKKVKVYEEIKKMLKLSPSMISNSLALVSSPLLDSSSESSHYDSNFIKDNRTYLEPDNACVDSVVNDNVVCKTLRKKRTGKENEIKSSRLKRTKISSKASLKSISKCDEIETDTDSELLNCTKARSRQQKNVLRQGQSKKDKHSKTLTKRLKNKSPLLESPLRSSSRIQNQQASDKSSEPLNCANASSDAQSESNSPQTNTLLRQGQTKQDKAKETPTKRLKDKSSLPESPLRSSTRVQNQQVSEKPSSESDASEVRHTRARKSMLFDSSDIRLNKRSVICDSNDNKSKKLKSMDVDSGNEVFTSELRNAQKRKIPEAVKECSNQNDSERSSADSVVSNAIATILDTECNRTETSLPSRRSLINTRIKNCYINLSDSKIPEDVLGTDTRTIKVRTEDSVDKTKKNSEYVSSPKTRRQSRQVCLVDSANIKQEPVVTDSLIPLEDFSSIWDSTISVNSIKEYKNDLFVGFENGKTFRLQPDGPLLAHVYFGHKGAVNAIGFYDSYMVTGSSDQSIILHNLDSNETVATLSVEESVQTICVKWNTIFVGTKNGKIAKFSTNKRNEKADIIFVGTNKDNVLDIYATKEGPRKILIVSTKLLLPSIRDAKTGLLLRSVKFSDVFYSLASNESTPFVYCGTRNNSVVVIDFTTGEKIDSIGLGKSVIKVIIKWDLVFTASYDGNVHVYSLNQTRLISKFCVTGVIIQMEIWNNKIVLSTTQNNPVILNFPTELKAYLGID